jgi:starch-binding outer membrane protein, SusD/RagB family
MKRLIRIVWSIVLIQIFISCKKDFLETPPTLNVVRQQYVSSINSCEDFLNGIYIVLSRDFYSGLNQLYPDLIADNIKPNGVTNFGTQYNWMQVASDANSNAPGPTNTNMNAIYTTGYTIIRNCSYLLENVDRFSVENPALADRIKGQSYALRALAHFQLVNIFAQPYVFSGNAAHSGIPYVTTSDYTQPVFRLSVADVYGGIVNDLQNAIPLLPETSATKTTINQIAAKGLLARVCLFKNDYLNAKSYATDVLKLVPVMKNAGSQKLYPDSLFRRGETEALFHLPPSNVNYNTAYASMQFKQTPNPIFIATSDIASIITERPNDLRKVWVTLNSGKWYINKFPSNVIGGFSNPNGSYFISIVRSSEMGLIAAESFAKLGKEDSARIFLDVIRQRADVTALSTIASGEPLLDSIYKERRKEFAFEGYRMFDLLRTGKGVTRIDGSNPSATVLPFGDSKTIAPLPLREVTLSGLNQNLGY